MIYNEVLFISWKKLKNTGSSCQLLQKIVARFVYFSKISTRLNFHSFYWRLYSKFLQYGSCLPVHLWRPRIGGYYVYRQWNLKKLSELKTPPKLLAKKFQDDDGLVLGESSFKKIPSILVQKISSRTKIRPPMLINYHVRIHEPSKIFKK